MKAKKGTLVFVQRKEGGYAYEFLVSETVQSTTIQRHHLNHMCVDRNGMD